MNTEVKHAGCHKKNRPAARIEGLLATNVGKLYYDAACDRRESGDRDFGNMGFGSAGAPGPSPDRPFIVVQVDPVPSGDYRVADRVERHPVVVSEE